MPITRELAETRLRKRYKEQADIYPRMWNDTPLSEYVRRNVRKVMEDGQLESYDRLPNWRPR